MSMKFEAAVVTKKRAGEEFNTDSVNINGKVLPREVILNGYKGAGIIDDTAYFSLVSSFVEGYSDASVASFEDFAARFREADTNPVSVLNDFFRNTVSALNSLNHISKEISVGAAYCGNRNVILARSGETSLFSYSNGVLKKINPENSMHDDGKSNYGCYTIPDVSVDDIFLLVSPGAAASLTDKDITDICRVSDGSVKKIVNIISRVAEAKPSSGGIGIIAIKILSNEFSVDEEVTGFAAAAVETAEEADNEIVKDADIEAAPELPEEHEQVIGGFSPSFDEENENEHSEVLEVSDNEETEQEETEEEKPQKKSKKAGMIILIVLAVLIVGFVLFGVAKITGIFGGKKPVEDDPEIITEIEITTEEETTEEEENSEEETEEETTEETTTARPVSYYRPSTTEPRTEAPTAAPETEAPSSETSTEAPVSEEPSSEPEATTAPEASPEENSSEEPSSEVPSDTPSDSPSEQNSSEAQPSSENAPSENTQDTSSEAESAA